MGQEMTKSAALPFNDRIVHRRHRVAVSSVVRCERLRLHLARGVNILRREGSDRHIHANFLSAGEDPVMRVLVAPDSFGGTLTAVEAAAAIVAGFRAVAPRADLTAIPMSDGGPGF